MFAFLGGKNLGDHSVPTSNLIRRPMNWLPSVVHASSTIESGAPRIDCLALFVYPPPSKLFRRPMNWLPSAVHSSSTIESGAPRIDCLELFVYPPPSNLIRRPMNWLPSAVHASSTIESGAPRIDFLALFANPPSLPFSGAPWIVFSFMHPPPKEFGAMLHDWLVRTL